MPSANGKLSAVQAVGDLPKLTGVELDAEIKKHLRSGVWLGFCLAEMRAGQKYLDLPGQHYSTFEEYCNSIHEISVRHAQQLIKASMIQGVISGRTVVRPEDIKPEGMLRELVPVCEFEREPLQHGGDIPVAIKNAPEVKKVWGEIVKDGMDGKAGDVRKYLAKNGHLSGERSKAVLDQTKGGRLARRVGKLTFHLWDEIRRLHEPREYIEGRKRRGVLESLEELRDEINEWIKALS